MSAAAEQHDRQALADEVRAAVSELLGAQRRLRARDPQRSGSLSYSQVRALVLLDDAGEATAGQLAKAADLTPASVTAMLDHLEADGMVERRRSAEDRRVVLVSLTAAGTALVREKRELWRARWEQAVDDLPDRDLRAAVEVMRRMTRMFDAL